MANKIKQHRERKNITQEELAKMVGVNRTAVTLWELGINDPRADKLVKLSDALNCTIDDLLCN